MTTRWGHKHSDPNIGVAEVLSATEIQIGDMVWYDDSDDTLKPASDFLWDTDLNTTQAAFKDAFVGVATQRTLAGEVRPINFAMNGRYRYEANAPGATGFVTKGLLAPAEGDAGSVLANQKLERTPAASRGIMRVMIQDMDATSTEVECEHFGSLPVLAALISGTAIPTVP